MKIPVKPKPVLRTVAVPPRPAAPLPKVAKEEPTERKKASSTTATVRLSDGDVMRADELQAIFQTNRGAVIKEGIKLLHKASTAQDAVLHITRADGTKDTVVIVKSGNVML